MSQANATVDWCGLARKMLAAVDELVADRKSFETEWKMYHDAWLREIGGRLIPKTHRIDALVLTTRLVLDEARHGVPAVGVGDVG